MTNENCKIIHVYEMENAHVWFSRNNVCTTEF